MRENKIHTGWKGELEIYKNNGADKIRAACKRLLNQIKRERYPLKFERSLIDWCIWKYTTCDFVFASRGRIPRNQDEDELPMGEKYAARHYSKKAWSLLNKVKNKSDSAIRELRFDHVWERQELRGKIADGKDLKNVFEEFVGCVVTKKEHHNLTKLSKTSKKKGWERYEGKVIYKYCAEKRTYCKYRVTNGKFTDCVLIE